MYLLNIFAGWVHLPVAVLNTADFTCHITGGHKKDVNSVADVLFDPTNDLDP